MAVASFTTATHHSLRDVGPRDTFATVPVDQLPEPYRRRRPTLSECDSAPPSARFGAGYIGGIQGPTGHTEAVKRRLATSFQNLAVLPPGSTWQAGSRRKFR